MKLKGEWDSGTSYDIGDVVRYSDGVCYVKQQDCAAGITPQETLYWGRTHEQEILSMMVDIMNSISTVASSIPDNISNEAITLSTETADYLITVDDSGDTPELTVTAIEEAAST